jgi:hypothetical protein
LPPVSFFVLPWPSTMVMAGRRSLPRVLARQSMTVLFEMPVASSATSLMETPSTRSSNFAWPDCSEMIGIV